MSEPIPESVPTSQDPRSKRPLKRRALTPVSQQASQVDALFAKPEREIIVPSSNALAKKSTLAPPPEIVANVQGSSAGAGSGEFHVYKASRRREYERLKMMDAEVAMEQADAEFEKKRSEQKKKDEEKTEKNRKKREKKQTKSGKVKGKTDDRDRIIDGAGKTARLGRKESSPNKNEVEAIENSNLPATAAEDVGVIIDDD
ncbi:MAG: hypothetical protein Q9164_004145 [Protoblastenia rupestris]